MRQLVTCSQMKALDQRTIREKKMPSMVLMERAAMAVVEEMEKKLGENEKILVICGNGNNGGDGIAIARLLHLKGYAAFVFQSQKKSKMSEETSLQKEIAQSYGVIWENNPGIDEYTTIVDALFGIGLSREITGEYGELFQKVNRSGAYVWAVDIPSGINGDTGAVMGHAIRADVTVTFAYGKAGLYLYPGAAWSGKVLVKDIGIYRDEEEVPGLFSLEEKDLELLPQRAPWGNKGTFGKVLLVAGSKNMAGAACFSGKSALFSGAGMVKIHTEEANRVILQQLLPEALFSSDEGPEGEEERHRRWQENLDWADVLVIGPGLGQSDRAREKLQYYLSHSKKPTVLDADALNLIGTDPSLWQFRDSSWIVTPHMGEFSRLVRQPVEEVKKDPIAWAKKLAEQQGVICVLKDARTVTAEPSGRVWVNCSGNDGMATAGSGDVLSGIIAGLLAQGAECGWAASLGVYLHGLAGDEGAGQKGRRSLCATDILLGLPEILRNAEG